MKIIFTTESVQTFDNTAACMPGRVEKILMALGKYPSTPPEPFIIKITEMAIVAAHSPSHVINIKRKGDIYGIALKSVACALQAAVEASKGIRSFAVCNPPGHHASKNRSWGFCYFSNIAIAVNELSKLNQKSVIVDIDMHEGDGTQDVMPRSAVYYHPNYPKGDTYVREVKYFLSNQKSDMLAISAGFDFGRFDWGDTLTARNYYELGRIFRDYADSKCNGRLFITLEGGYNQHVIGLHSRALIAGIEKE